MPHDPDDNSPPPGGNSEDDQPTVEDSSSSQPEPGSADLVQGMADNPTVIMDPSELPPALIGKVIEGFKIERIIGTGGMGAVYEATQASPSRTVALKVIRAGLTSPAILRRFQYEAEALAKLQHIGIARIYAAGTWDDGNGATPWFAMEYIAEAELLTSFARKRSLSIRDRISLFRKVCDAVHHGHQKGVIHRDLKPGNILVDGAGQPKIIDFGVARSVESDLAVTTIQTDAGALIGTLQYMSPEQARANPSEIDIRTDVYALGVILYELLCDQLPYEVRKLAVHEAIRVVMDEDPRRPSTLSRRLRGDLEVITLKALEKEPRRRYQSALELEQDLQRHVSGEPVSAVPPSVLYRARKFIRRNKLGVTAASLLVAIGIVFLVAAWQWSRADAARQERNRMVRELIDFYMVEHFQSISRLAGSQAAREVIIERSLEYLDALRLDAQDDPDLQLILAEGLQAVGNNHWSMRMSSRGQLTEAIEAWESSRHALDQLAAVGSPDDRVVMAGIRIRTLLSDGYRRAGQMEDAITSAAEAGELLAQVPDPLASLVHARLHIDVLMDQANLAAESSESMARLEQAMTIAQQAREAWPDDAMLLRDVSVLHNRLGNHSLQAKEHEDALSHFQASLAIRQERLAQEPDSNSEQRDLMLAHRYIAQTLLQMGRAHEASTRYTDEILPIANQLMERNRLEDESFDPRSHRDLCIAKRECGEALLTANEPQQAAEILASAFECITNYADSNPDDTAATRDYGRCGASHAAALIELGQETEAQAAIDEVRSRLEPEDGSVLPNSTRQILSYCDALEETLSPPPDRP